MSQLMHEVTIKTVSGKRLCPDGKMKLKYRNINGAVNVVHKASGIISNIIIM